MNWIYEYYFIVSGFFIAFASEKLSFSFGDNRTLDYWPHFIYSLLFSLAWPVTMLYLIKSYINEHNNQ